MENHEDLKTQFKPGKQTNHSTKNEMQYIGITADPRESQAISQNLDSRFPVSSGKYQEHHGSQP